MQGHGPYPPTMWWAFQYDGAVRNGLYDARWFLDNSHPRNIAGGQSENAGRLRGVTREPGGGWGGRWLADQDVVRSLVPSHGDYRLFAARETIAAPASDPETGTTTFQKHISYDETFTNFAYAFVLTRYNEIVPATWGHFGGAWGWRNLNKLTGPWQLTDAPYHDLTYPDFPLRHDYASNPVRKTGDFDNGIALVYDGPYINKPDEGNAFQLDSNRVPYFDENWWAQSIGPSYFSPNRQIPSPVMFGSLPSLTKKGTAWTTLLFRPHKDHPGTEAPHDSWWLDLFWMPVVEPYAISDTFSTAGKINMNYQILPFTYIRRDAGLRAVFKSEELMAIPKTNAPQYKTWGDAAGLNFRRSIDVTETLKQWETLFTSGKIFQSPGQLCEQYLVPNGTTLANIDTFWKDHALTGDNSRERPYANIHPRLTTQSNTFTVHYRVQTIKKARTSQPDGFDPAKDRIDSEQRGSTTVERFLDPTDPDLPDPAAEPDPVSLHDFFQFRITQTRRFNH
jgi:uncharacterized protein (TIGR02600 family)